MTILIAKLINTHIPTYYNYLYKNKCFRVIWPSNILNEEIIAREKEKIFLIKIDNLTFN